MKRLLTYLSLILLSNHLFAAKTIPIKIATLADVAIYPKRSASATVISLNESTISSRIQAQVEEIFVRVGDIVEKNSMLVRLDCIDYVLASKEIKANLESLKSQIELAERRFKRTQTLTLTQSISEEIFDEHKSNLGMLQADYRAAMAKYDMAKINESRCIVKTPFRALVTERISAIGQFTNIGTSLFKIIDIEQLEISAQVSNDDIKQIKQTNQLFFEYQDHQYPVKLRTISQAIDIKTRNREIRLLFTSELALPGAAGKLSWTDQRAHIPGKYLIRRDNQLGIFTVTDQNKASFIPIPMAQTERASPTILPVSTILITEGHFSLKNDDIITISNQ